MQYIECLNHSNDRTVLQMDSFLYFLLNGKKAKEGIAPVHLDTTTKDWSTEKNI